MKKFAKLIFLFFLSLSVSGFSQTNKKTTTPVKKTVVKKSTSTQDNQAKAATVAKAKQDSIVAVNALAMKIAKQIIAEDSIKKARIAEQIAADERLKQEELLAEKNTKPEKSVNAKSGKKETDKVKWAKTDKPARENAEEPKPVAASKETTEPKFFIGLRATGIAAIVVGKDTPDYTKPYFGYGGGLIANFALGSHFSFQPEVLYAQEGFSLKGDEGGTKIDAAFRLSGIQVPLLIKYSFGEFNKGFFINAGPYGTYLLNSKVHDKTPGGEKYTIKPEDTTIEYGVAAGFGVAVPLGKGRLLIEARGNYYLGATGEELDLTDAAFVTGTASVGYLFPIGR